MSTPDSLIGLPACDNGHISFLRGERFRLEVGGRDDFHVVRIRCPFNESDDVEVVPTGERFGFQSSTKKFVSLPIGEDGR
jgi:hypothetical protein